MSLDPYVPPDPGIRALIAVAGAQAWKLWSPNAPPSDVYLTIRFGRSHVSDKIAFNAPHSAWLIALGTLLDRIKLLGAA